MKQHDLMMIQLNYMLARPHRISDAIELGKAILNLGFDEITDGFWVWQIDSNIEYYSPKFRHILGYESEKDFPNVPASWQNAIKDLDAEKALQAYERHKKDSNSPYVLGVTYNKKNGGTINLVCSGTIVNRGEDVQYMIGTHEIV